MEAQTAGCIQFVIRTIVYSLSIHVHFRSTCVFSIVHLNDCHGKHYSLYFERDHTFDGIQQEYLRTLGSIVEHLLPVQVSA